MAPEHAEAAYSERMLILSALEALVRECSTIRNITRIEAQTLIGESLASAECPVKDAGPRRGRMMMHLDTMPCFLVAFEPRGLGTLSLGAEHPTR
jgi:hypothetical protein